MKTIRFKSKSEKNVWHKVKIDDNKVRCSCKGFSFTGHCWHSEKVLNKL